MTRSFTPLLRRSLSPELSLPFVDYGVALLRVTVGSLIFYVHGWHKLVAGLEFLREGGPWQLVEEIASMHFPVPVFTAFFATLVQLVCALGLIVGLGTRWNAIALAGILGGAVAQNLLAGRDPQLAVLYTLVALAFGFIGGGRFSLDARLFRRGGTTREVRAAAAAIPS